MTPLSEQDLVAETSRVSGEEWLEGLPVELRHEWPSAMPPGVPCAFIALAYSRNSSVVSGNFEKPAFFDASMR